jgi:CPA2 family monovalent cation:H+ antiporter-2
MFLLFSLGLEFNLKKLGKVGAAALVAGFIEILMMFVGYRNRSVFSMATNGCVVFGRNDGHFFHYDYC